MKPKSKAAKKAAPATVKKAPATAAKKTVAKKTAAKTTATKTAAKKAPTKQPKAAARARSIPPVPAKPLTQPFHTSEAPEARGTHTTAGREEIREITRRVMGSRQSQRPVERHNQARKKR
jgi:DNA-binding protein HU-beta